MVANEVFRIIVVNVPGFYMQDLCIFNGYSLDLPVGFLPELVSRGRFIIDSIEERDGTSNTYLSFSLSNGVFAVYLSNAYDLP